MYLGKNPFSISFGRKPVEYITRLSDSNRVITTFTQPPVTDQVYFLMGIRGSGKTVLLTDICERIGRIKNWLVIKISPLDDILEALYSDLQNSRYFILTITKQVMAFHYSVQVLRLTTSGRSLIW